MLSELTKKEILVSLVISNYNGLSYLKDSLPQILKIKNDNNEVIVIDNNSDDGSKNYLEKIENITVIHNPFKGSKNKGLNQAIDRARGEYLLFIDNDVVITDKNILANLIAQYNSSKNTGLLTLALVNKGENQIYFYGEYLSLLSFIKKNKRIPLKDGSKINNSKVAGVLGAAFFTRKQLFREIGYFDDMLDFGGEDVDVGIRSILMGHNNYIYSKTIATHIGMSERTENKKYRNKFFGNTIGFYLTIIKNYSVKNLLISIILFTMYQILKTFKDVFMRRDLFLLKEFSKIPFFIFSNRKRILHNRRKIQEKRLINKDTFLGIKLKYETIN